LQDVGLQAAAKNIKLVEELATTEEDICRYLDKVLPQRIDKKVAPWIIHYF
jgi:hypothetical protein